MLIIKNWKMVTSLKALMPPFALVRACGFDTRPIHCMSMVLLIRFACKRSASALENSLRFDPLHANSQQRDLTARWDWLIISPSELFFSASEFLMITEILFLLSFFMIKYVQVCKSMINLYHKLRNKRRNKYEHHTTKQRCSSHY